MRVIALTRYERTGASSRMRFHQYFPSLRASGLEIFNSPMLSDAYVRDLQTGRRRWLEVFRAYGRRLSALRGVREFELLWIEKEALPWLPARLEAALLGGHVPYVLDYDDAVFHQYDQHANAVVRHFFGQKHRHLMRRAALVVAGNDYIADYARVAGATAVEVLPTVIDLARYPPSDSRRSKSAPATVGWIGQRATAAFLKPLTQLFEDMSSHGLAQFAAVGIDATAFGLPMRSELWSEETEVASIDNFDIGIMPLMDGPFERGKCGYKIIQYMACGLPVVASPVGVNCHLVEHGINGYLANTPQEWAEALHTLAADPALRQRMGQTGRKIVERRYCLEATAPRLAALLRQAALKP